MKKMMKQMLSLTLALILCMGSVVIVKAAEPTPEPEPITKAAIKKVLEMPEGTDVPTATFTYTITPEETSSPTVDSVTISFTSADEKGTTTGNKKVVTKESNATTGASIFDGVAWTKPGVYTYTVKETANTYTITDAVKEKMIYSAAEYIVHVYVKDNPAYDSSDPASEQYIVYGIGDFVEVPDTTETKETKIDPTPGQSEMVFTNRYTKNNGGKDLDQVLTVRKTVTAVTGGSVDTTTYFDFEMTMTAAYSLAEQTTYKVYIYDNTAGANVPGADLTSANGIAAGTITGDYFTVTAGTKFDFKLKHGQELVFVDAHVGTSYIVAEKAAPNFTASVKTIYGLEKNKASADFLTTYADAKYWVSTATDSIATSSKANTATNTGITTTTELDGFTKVGEKENSTEFTNKGEMVTPTGINVSNLPFIMMLVLAAGAFVVFVVVKARKRRTY